MIDDIVLMEFYSVFFFGTLPLMNTCTEYDMSIISKWQRLKFSNDKPVPEIFHCLCRAKFMSHSLFIPKIPPQLHPNQFWLGLGFKTNIHVFKQIQQLKFFLPVLKRTD